MLKSIAFFQGSFLWTPNVVLLFYEKYTMNKQELVITPFSESLTSIIIFYITSGRGARNKLLRRL